MTVIGAGGEPVVLASGVIDENARQVYMNGQCAALSVELSARTGWPIVTRTWFEDGSDGTGSGRSVEYLIHTTVRTPDGMLLDINGVNDPAAIELEDEESWTVWPADQAQNVLARHAAGLREQNFAAAATFVDPVLDLYAQDHLAR